MKHRLIVALGLILVGCADADGPAADAAGATGASGAGTAAAPAAAEPAPTAITDIEPTVAVIAEEVAYGETEEQNLRGYMVLPADAVDVPGVIMIHEWWGLNDNIRAMARRLAGEGYAVLALDLYGGQTATSPAEAERLMAAVMRNRQATIENIRQAHRYLDEFVLAPRIAVLGWGLGGAWSLEAALDLRDRLDAVVMFYGDLVTNTALLANLEAPLLGIFAQHDESIPSRLALAFRDTLNELGKTARVEVYLTVDHAFANPAGSAYDHEAAVRSWTQALAFLDDRLR
ncbi:MAG TPA: dienelactone hydrolase family protein [Gammaproteobacteria bacterium]|nr:dienelactone hydrolase family protein [Gammaproteobacteria bacterium]